MMPARPALANFVEDDGMMLQAMKGKFGTFILKIFAVLLIISFGAWGIGDMITGQGLPTHVADVGDTQITANQFQKNFRVRLSELRRQFGQRLDSQQARQMGFADMTLDRLISLRLLQLHAADLNLSVGDDQVLDQIKRQPGFSDGQGGINANVFRDALSRNNLTEDRYVATLRDEITRSHLTDVVAAGSVAPNHMVDLFYRYRNEKRTADVVIVPRASGGATPEPTYTQLGEFHSKNEALFTAPELRTITALYLDPDEMAKEISISDDELKNEYENRLSSLIIPERRRVRQIVTADEATVRRAKQSLAEGRSFTDVAKDIAGMDEETTQLGFVTAGRLPGEIGTVASKAALNEPSEPVKSPLGWHIILVERIEPGKIPTFEDVRASIRLDLGRERAVDDLVKIANQLEDALAGGATIDEAARQINIATFKTPPIDARGRTADGKPAKTLPKEDEFLRTAFEVQDGEVSDLTETRTGGYLIVRVDGITPPAVRPLDRVRDRAIVAWKLSQQNEVAKKKAGEILEKVKNGGSLTRVAKDASLQVKRSKPFTRVNRAAGSRIPPALAGELFKLRPGGGAMAPSQDGYAVAQLNDIQVASPHSDKEGLEGLKNRLHGAVAEDIMAQYASALRTRYSVRIDRDAIDRLFNEGTLGQN